jgi:hypothetical protein
MGMTTTGGGEALVCEGGNEVAQPEIKTARSKTQLG